MLFINTESPRGIQRTTCRSGHWLELESSLSFRDSWGYLSLMGPSLSLAFWLSCSLRVVSIWHKTIFGFFYMKIMLFPRATSPNSSKGIPSWSSMAISTVTVFAKHLLGNLFWQVIIVRQGVQKPHLKLVELLTYTSSMDYWYLFDELFIQFTLSPGLFFHWRRLLFYGTSEEWKRARFGICGNR